MTTPFPVKTWASRRHRQLAQMEMDLLLRELTASEPVPSALDTAPSHSPAMRRFLGY